MSRITYPLALFALLIAAPAVRADWLNGLMRELGLAWSDGYHSYSTCPRCPQPPTLIEHDGPHFPLRPQVPAGPRYPPPATREHLPTPARRPLPRPMPTPQPESNDPALPPGVTQAPELAPPHSPPRAVPWDEKARRTAPGAAYFEAARRAPLPR